MQVVGNHSYSDEQAHRYRIENEMWSWYFSEETESRRLCSISLRLTKISLCCLYTAAIFVLLGLVAWKVTVIGLGFSIFSIGIVLLEISEAVYVEAAVVKYFELGALPRHSISEISLDSKVALRAAIRATAMNTYHRRVFVTRDLPRLRKLLDVTKIEVWLPLLPAISGFLLKLLHWAFLDVAAEASAWINMIFFSATMVSAIIVLSLREKAKSIIKDAREELTKNNMFCEPRHITS